MNVMVNKVFDFIKKNNILEYGDSVLLGVSGGADSVFMLHVLCKLREQMNLNLFVVHVNHHIRGKAAQNDADFVERLCRQLSVPYTQKDAEVPKISEETGMSEEEAGRWARYQIFYEMAAEHQNSKIAVAHNFNDNSETILFNLFRGTGIRGLTGIPVKREQIVRPVLCCMRSEIEKYLKENELEYCIDQTNNMTAYTRNKIRLHVLPYIKENINAKAEYNIVNAAENLSEIEDFLVQETETAYAMYVQDNTLLEKGFSLHQALLGPVIRMMIERKAGKLKDITRTHILSVLSLREMQVSSQIVLPYNLVAERVYGGICIDVKKENKGSMREENLIAGGEIFHNDKIEAVPENEAFDRENIQEMLYTKWLNYDKIDKLTVRNRQKGDYIVIDEQGRKQKLKDYFINKKIPREKRDEILLLADGSHIVWIVGYRISAAYKVTKETSSVLRVTYKSEKHEK